MISSTTKSLPISNRNKAEKSVLCTYFSGQYGKAVNRNVGPCIESNLSHIVLGKCNKTNLSKAFASTMSQFVSLALRQIHPLRIPHVLLSSGESFIRFVQREKDFNTPN